MLLPCCGAVGVMSLYLALVWKDWALGHLQALCQGGSWGWAGGWSPWRFCSHFIDKLTSNPLSHFNFSIPVLMS